MKLAKEIKDDVSLLTFLLRDLKNRGWSREKVTSIKHNITNTAKTNNWQTWEWEKHLIWQKIREGYSENACARVKTEYQAPSFRHSLWSEAGSREGQVYGNMNDYTRDQHPIAYELGQELKNTYQPILRGIEAHVTVSGMAALATTLNAIGRMKVNNTIMIGKESYFQNQEVLSAGTGRVVTFDEMDLVTFQKLFIKEKPGIVMVDTLSNTEKLVMPNISEIQRIISTFAKGKTYLILDNSMLGPGVNYKEIWKVRGSCEPIIWESLNKFFQYGMDRTTGGVIFARGIKLNGEIFRARMHCGTIMPDSQCLMIPKQNSRVMSWYLARIARNKELLSNILRAKGKKVRVAERRGFNGAQIIMEIEKPTPWKINNLIARVVRKAKRRGVQISSGTSFGLPTTRIYLTARKTHFARMFCRISVGWETEEAIREIAEVIS